MRLLFSPLAIAAIALIAIGAALWQLQALSTGLTVTRARSGEIPLTVYRPAGGEPAPAVVVAHGFAGSQQLMQSFATTLARNGYVAVTFDFPGHGRNPKPLTGGLTDAEAMQRDLLATMDQVSLYALTLAGTDGRLAVLGHSMAADIVVRHAQANPAVQGTVAVSLFFPKDEALYPRNLLVIDGALESSMLLDQGRKIIGAANNGGVEPGATYGRFDDGSARRLVFARGVEHIGVLYSRDAMRESVLWLDQVFGRNGSGFVDRRGRWLGLLFLGVITLAWPLCGLLPRLAAPLSVPAAGWGLLLPVALAPALLTPLILWRLPISFLPLLLGDYLMLHFALYGLLTAALLWFLRGRVRPIAPMRTEPLRFTAAAILVTAYSLLAFGLPLDAYVVSFMPGAWRLPLVAALIAGTLPYFLADEWLTRRLAPLRGAYALTKFCFLLSLVIAVALNLEKLFFLVIIVPAILLLFGVYGLFSAWVNQRTGHPLIAAVANAVVFGWFIAVTFPVVSPVVNR